MNRREFISTLILLTLSVVLAAEAGAQTITIENPLSYATIEELIDHITDLLATITLIVVPVIIIYAAFVFTTSGGNPEKIYQAQNIFKWAIIGFAIVWLSKAIIDVIMGVLGVKP